jgi:hypothetical protein
LPWHDVGVRSVLRGHLPRGLTATLVVAGCLLACAGSASAQLVTLGYNKAPVPSGERSVVWVVYGPDLQAHSWCRGFEYHGSLGANPAPRPTITGSGQEASGAISPSRLCEFHGQPVAGTMVIERVTLSQAGRVVARVASTWEVPPAPPIPIAGEGEGEEPRPKPCVYGVRRLAGTVAFPGELHARVTGTARRVAGKCSARTVAVEGWVATFPDREESGDYEVAVGP